MPCSVLKAAVSPWKLSVSKVMQYRYCQDNCINKKPSCR